MEKQNKEQQKVKGINAISAKELQDTKIALSKICYMKG